MTITIRKRYVIGVLIVVAAVGMWIGAIPAHAQETPVIAPAPATLDAQSAQLLKEGLDALGSTLDVLQARLGSTSEPIANAGAIYATLEATKTSLMTLSTTLDGFTTATAQTEQPAIIGQEETTPAQKEVVVNESNGQENMASIISFLPDAVTIPLGIIILALIVRGVWIVNKRRSYQKKTSPAMPAPSASQETSPVSPVKASQTPPAVAQSSAPTNTTK